MKAISPVIATVIIVSVAIAISIAVALWLAGVTTGFTGVERLEIYNAYAEKKGDNFVVYVYLRNTGTTDATIKEIFINNKPHDVYGNDVNITGGVIGHTIRTGEEFNFALNLSTTKFTSGQSVDITIRTAAGRDYPKTVVLP